MSEVIAKVAEDAGGDLPLVTAWSLHTIKGGPVLKLEVVGERYYQRGEVVSDADFGGWENESTSLLRKTMRPYGFRGVIHDVKIDLDWGDGGRPITTQRIEILVEQHAMITSGLYKPRTVIRSPPDKSKPVAANDAGKLYPAPPPEQPAKIQGPGRQFDFDM